VDVRARRSRAARRLDEPGRMAIAKATAPK
jgi:hypothetical protein